MHPFGPCHQFYWLGFASPIILQILLAIIFYIFIVFRRRQFQRRISLLRNYEEIPLNSVPPLI